MCSTSSLGGVPGAPPFSLSFDVRSRWCWHRPLLTLRRRRHIGGQRLRTSGRGVWPAAAVRRSTRNRSVVGTSRTQGLAVDPWKPKRAPFHSHNLTSISTVDGHRSLSGPRATAPMTVRHAVQVPVTEEVSVPVRRAQTSVRPRTLATHHSMAMYIEEGLRPQSSLLELLVSELRVAHGTPFGFFHVRS